MFAKELLLGVAGLVLATGSALGQDEAARSGAGESAGLNAVAGWDGARGDAGGAATDASEDLEAGRAALPESPGESWLGQQPAQERKMTRRTEPDRIAPRLFSSFGVAIVLGTEGAGVQVATPLTAKLNLRVGVEGFSFNPNVFEDGFAVVGNIRLLSVFAGVDYHPFYYKYARVRISPGVNFYNGNRMHALATVPGGQTFDLGYGTFTSSPTDPVTGKFDLDFGRRIAPRLTLGLGNLSPRRGQRWSFPFEIGAEYIGRPPKISLALAGSTCDATSCSPVLRDPEAQRDLVQEQINLNRDIPGVLRFLPIVTLGVSYRLGH